MPIPSSAFSSSNHHQMGSNAVTDINQGGGSKKAGLFASVGKDSWTSVFHGANGLGKSSASCKSLQCMQFTVNANTKQSRPIGSFASPNTYWGVR